MASTPNLLRVFSRLDQSTTQALAEIRRPLDLGLVALSIGRDKAGCIDMAAVEIEAALEAADINLRAYQVISAFKRAGDKVKTKEVDGQKRYRLMVHGKEAVAALLIPTGLHVSYLGSGTPRTARKLLKELFSGLSGEVRVCDPYYGERSLDTLEFFPAVCTVRFLTGKSNEPASKLGRAVADFRKEHPNIELRRLPKGKGLHDRYVLSPDTLILLGHGIKDIGDKGESFAVCLPRGIAGDIKASLRIAFDKKWASTVPL